MSAEMGPSMAVAAPVAAAPRGEIGGGLTTSVAVAAGPFAEASSLHLPGFVSMVGEVAPAATDYHVAPSGKDIFAGLSQYSPEMDAPGIIDTATPQASSPTLGNLQARAEAWGAYMALYAQPVGKVEQQGEQITLSPEILGVAPLGEPTAGVVEPSLMPAVALTPEVTLPTIDAVAITREVTPTLFDPAPRADASDEAVAARAAVLLEELGMEESIPEVDAVLAERKQEQLGTKPMTAAEVAEDVVDDVVSPDRQRRPHFGKSDEAQKLSDFLTEDELAARLKQDGAEVQEDDVTTPLPPEEPEVIDEDKKEPDPDRRPRPEILYIHDDPVNAYRAQLLQTIANNEVETNEGPYKVVMGTRMRDEFLRLASSDQNAQSGILEEEMGDHDGSLDFVGNEFAQRGNLTVADVEGKIAYAVSRHTAVDIGEGGLEARPEDVAKVVGGSRRYAAIASSPMVSDGM